MDKQEAKLVNTASAAVGFVGAFTVASQIRADRRQAEFENEQLAYSQEQLAAAQQAAYANERMFQTTLEMRDEQRAHNFAMWRQSDDGKAYLAWKNRAWLLIGVLKSRDKEWADAIRDEIAATQPSALPELQLPQELPVDEELAKSVPHSSATHRVRHNLSRVLRPAAAVIGIGSAIIWLVGAALWLITFGWLTTWFPAVGTFMVWVTGGVVGGVLLNILSHMVDDRDWAARRRSTRAEIEGRRKLARQNAKQQLEVQRTALRESALDRLGFDPAETDEDDWPAWQQTEATTAVEDRLKDYMVSAYTGFPPENQLPALELPEVVPADTFKIPALRQLAQRYTQEAS